jgi:hypothetical protein
MNSVLERRVNLAIFLMQCEQPLPLDLETFLLSHGIDVAALDTIHRR